MLCILYVIVVGTCLGIVGSLVERVLPATWPRRWVWCVVIPVSIALPGIYRSQHAASVTDVLAQQAVRAPLSQALGTASLSALDPDWWARIGSYDPMINRLSLLASAVLLIWLLANMWRVSLAVRLSPSGRGDSSKSAVVDGVPVLVTDSMGPATVGLWRSLVLIPRWVLVLPGVQRQYVLRHEDEHRRAHDARLLFVASLALVLIPWNIALWWQLRRLRLAVEMDCDNRVVAALGDAPAYGELLFKIAQASSHGPRLQPAFLGGMGMLERRLTPLLAPTPLRHVQRFLLPAVAFALLLVVLSMPHPVLARGEHAHVRMTSSVATTESNQTRQR